MSVMKMVELRVEKKVVKMAGRVRRPRQPQNPEPIAWGFRAAPPAEKHEGPFRIINHGETQVTFRSKAIVLSNGGSQSLHPEFFNWFPFMKDRRGDLLTSD